MRSTAKNWQAFTELTITIFTIMWWLAHTFSINTDTSIWVTKVALTRIR
jgi:hypothetical protein